MSIFVVDLYSFIPHSEESQTLIPAPFEDLDLGQQYWDERDIASGPFLPFFSNCEGFDSRMTLYDVFENEECDLIEEDSTTPVTSWTFLASGVSDQCDYSTVCVIEEDYKVPSDGPRWYEAPSETVLFLLSSFGVDLEEAIDGDEYFEDILDEMVEVEVENDGFESGKIPGVVKLSVGYQQLSPKKKRIVIASIELEDFYSPENDELPEYELEIELTNLQFFDLLNLFELDVPLYVVFDILIIFVLFSFIFIIWIFARFVFSKVEIFSSIELLFSESLTLHTNFPITSLHIYSFFLLFFFQQYIL